MAKESPYHMKGFVFRGSPRVYDVRYPSLSLNQIIAWKHGFYNPKYEVLEVLPSHTSYLPSKAQSPRKEFIYWVGKKCLHCGLRHFHGFSYEDPLGGLGHRASHCSWMDNYGRPVHGGSNYLVPSRSQPFPAFVDRVKYMIYIAQAEEAIGRNLSEFYPDAYRLPVKSPHPTAASKKRS